MVKDLKKIADLLDKERFFREADLLDNILIKVSEDTINYEDDEEESDEEESDDDYISALTMVIEKVSSSPESVEKREQLRVLNSLLEELF
jgi:hypothetical protein